MKTETKKTTKTNKLTFPARPADLPAAELNSNARTVLSKRYLKRNEQGEPVETPEDMFWRVAWHIAVEDAKFGASEEAVLKLAREFYALMVTRRFEPNSPTLMNAGRPLGQLSACFVLPVEDALSNGKNGIYDTLRAMALVHQSGGGTGFSFSRLRPTGDIVKSTTGVASGPVSFMKLYDASTEVVKQGGTRRGANMGILRVDHPDILEFIDCKQDITQVTNFNISVGVTDAFMEAVEKGESYDLIHPRSKEVVGQLDARTVFDKVVKNAWNTGEPGVFFIDRANFYNPVPHMGSYEATNPCGEQPLLPYDVCNLGSVNAARFVLPEGKTAAEKDIPEFARGFEWAKKVDWKDFRRVVRLSTHFLDNVIDANQYPLPEIHDLAHKIRRIGLGPMGVADFMVRVGVPYNSVDGVEVSRALARFIDEEAKNESEALSTVRGVFPEWERSIWGPDATAAKAPNGERIRPMRRLRNCNVNTVAPTGTISIIAGCSSGIEPLFAVAFMRNQAGVMMPDVNPDFVEIAKAGGWYSDDLMKRIAEEGHIHFSEVPLEIQKVFVTAHDTTPAWHVQHQAAWQEYVDSAISKTTNFPHSATEQDVREIYELAFRLGCKGVTVYRDGSRDGQVLSTGATKKASESRDGEEGLEAKVAELQAEVERLKNAVPGRREKRSRPAVLRGTTRKVASPMGDVFVTINEDDVQQAFEVFATLGKAGSVVNADVEAICRLISLALRFNIPVAEVHKQLRGISSDKAIGFGANKVLSLPDAIAQAIELREVEKQGVQEELLPLIPATPAQPVKLEITDKAEMGLCPDCGSTPEIAEGCMKCHICGFSECG